MVFPFVNDNMEPKRFLFRQSGDAIEQTHIPLSQNALKISSKLFALTQNACRSLDKWLYTIEVFRPMRDEVEITNTGFDGVRVYQYFNGVRDEVYGIKHQFEVADDELTILKYKFITFLQNLLPLTSDIKVEIRALLVPKSYLPSINFVSPEMKKEVVKENPDDTKLFGEKIANDGEIGLKFPIKISQILERPLNIKYYAKKAFSTSFLLLLVLKTVDFTTDLALNVRYYDQLEEAFYQYFPNKGSCHENSPMACHFTGKDRMDSSTFFYVSLSIFLLTYFAELMFMTFYNGSKHYRATLIGYCCWENLTRNKQWIKLPAWFIISAVNYITGLWYESFMQKFTKYWIFTYDEMKQGIDINGCEYCQNCPQRETCICVHCGRNANNAAKGKLQQFSNTGTSLCHFVIYPPY